MSGGRNASSPKPGQMIPIVVGDVCQGFLYRRRGEFEAFTIDKKSVGDVKSVGIFPDEKSASPHFYHYSSAVLSESAASGPH